MASQLLCFSIRCFVCGKSESSAFSMKFRIIRIKIVLKTRNNCFFHITKHFKKDINAVTQPMVAPRINDNVKMLQKSPTALKKAFISKPPVLE